MPLRPRWIVLTCCGFAGAIVFNLGWAGVQQGLWGWWLPWLHVAYFPTVILFSLLVWLAVGLRPWMVLERKGLFHAAGLGAAYGCFSGLWHCCAPLWDADGLAWPLVALAIVGWAAAFGGYIAGVGVQLRAPRGELLGALLFAVGYPWHTPLWFAQGLIGGAFVVWLARQTSSLLTPGIFLATAYLVHTTLPFAVSPT